MQICWSKVVKYVMLPSFMVFYIVKLMLGEYLFLYATGIC